MTFDIDDKWFKAQQRKAGVTAEDIAQIMGRSRTNVSHILNGRQRMSLEWGQAFSEALQVPLATILEKAGVTKPQVAQQLTPGFTESDATPWLNSGRADDPVNIVAAALGAGRPGTEVWQVRGRSMLLSGYQPNDHIVIDTYASERIRAGDVVIAQHHQPNGAAIALLRRYEPPVLVAASTDVSDRRVLVVDGANVVIKGKVLARWGGP